MIPREKRSALRAGSDPANGHSFLRQMLRRVKCGGRQVCPDMVRDTRIRLGPAMDAIGIPDPPGKCPAGKAPNAGSAGMRLRTARAGGKDSAEGFQCFAYLRLSELVVSFSSTSWAPPSTMETEETSVSLAFSRSSGMVRAPQLHMVERTLEREVAMPSLREPA